MSKEKSDGLLKKYMAAESTLEEEEKLFTAKNQDPGIEEWSKYVKQKRKKAPTNLNDAVWKSIQTRKRKKQRFLAILSGVAASIVLFITFFIANTGNKNISYDEKEALLNEALSMFSDEKHGPSNQSIVYEDEMIIIYTTSN